MTPNNEEMERLARELFKVAHPIHTHRKDELIPEQYRLLSRHVAKLVLRARIEQLKHPYDDLFELKTQLARLEEDK